jgi:hypothetical protein
MALSQSTSPTMPALQSPQMTSQTGVVNPQSARNAYASTLNPSLQFRQAHGAPGGFTGQQQNNPLVASNPWNPANAPGGGGQYQISQGALQGLFPTSGSLVSRWSTPQAGATA